MELLAALLVSAAQAPAPLPAPAPAPDWKAFADCAAANLADAQSPDPGRPAASKARMFATGHRYWTAAAGELRAQDRDTPHKAAVIVKAYVVERTKLFSFRPRPDVEAFVKSCPTLPR